MLSAKQEVDMAFDFTAAEHKLLTNFVDDILEAYREGKISLLVARADLAHVIAAAALDNEESVRSHLNTDLDARLAERKRLGAG